MTFVFECGSAWEKMKPKFLSELYEMEHVGGDIKQEAVPQYVHPNTHISG